MSIYITFCLKKITLFVSSQQLFIFLSETSYSFFFDFMDTIKFLRTKMKLFIFYLVLNVVEGEKTQGKTKKRKLHSKEIPKTQRGSNSTGS